MATDSTPAVDLKGMKILLTGGTGFIGEPLVDRLLQMGASVTLYSRSDSAMGKRARQRLGDSVRWCSDFAQLRDQERFFCLINLAGESLAAGRWTRAKKQRLIDSRIGTTEALFAWVKRAHYKPRYLISASAVGFYGAQGTAPLNEVSTTVPGFSQALCQNWEVAADQFSALGIAVCKLRLGVVLAPRGGAFAQLRRSFDFKVATVMGAGRHYFSWIHLQDLLQLFEFLLVQAQRQPIQGAVNATAPYPLSYVDLARQLANARKTWLTVHLPPWLMRLMLGEMADELLLNGQNAVPERLQQLNFPFAYPHFSDALRDLL